MTASVAHLALQSRRMRSILRVHQKLVHPASRRRVTRDNPYLLGPCLALLVVAGLILKFGPSLQLYMTQQ